MSDETRATIPGSQPKHPSRARFIAPVASDEIIQVSVILRRKSPFPETASHAKHFQSRSRVYYTRAYGAATSDIDAVKSFAQQYNLRVVDTHQASRTVILSGTAADLEKAFNVKLGEYEAPSKTRYRGCAGPMTMPARLQAIVIAVLGLDNQAAAAPHFRIARQQSLTGKFTPLQLAQIYKFPTNLKGQGQSIALIELGGGYRQADLDTYFANLNLPTPSVTAVPVDGADNQPGSRADGEVMLDIEVAGAIAPQAEIFVYFAPNTEQGFHNAVAAAVHDTARAPAIISISWGGPEDSWSSQARDALNAVLQDAAATHITVTAAAGDRGSSDGVNDGAAHADFPAASPYALGCGGTTLQTNGATSVSEQVWNNLASSSGATGGGVSRVFARPDYQNGIDVPAQPNTQFAGRGVPDVAGDADPSTGYIVRVNGRQLIVGGTSAVAPLWAGLIARFNQQLGQPLGFAHPFLYQLTETVFNDIVTGNNGSFSAKQGWDACTGLGSPNGTAILQALAQSPNP